MRDDLAYLEDILVAIERIEKYAARGKQHFDNDELIQTWIVYHIQIIGEAVGKLSDNLKCQNPSVPWAAIKAMRNVLVHFYFGINKSKVWNTVINDLPALKNEVSRIAEQLENSGA